MDVGSLAGWAEKAEHLQNEERIRDGGFALRAHKACLGLVLAGCMHKCVMHHPTCGWPHHCARDRRACVSDTTGGTGDGRSLSRGVTFYRPWRFASQPRRAVEMDAERASHTSRKHGIFSRPSSRTTTIGSRPTGSTRQSDCSPEPRRPIPGIADLDRGGPGPGVHQGLGTLLDRLERTFDSFDRLEKQWGHFYNWYNTRTLQALPPRYLSTVDSGNLLGCLVALERHSCKRPSEPFAGAR